MAAQFMLDEFIVQSKQNIFRIKVFKGGDLPRRLVIDGVNGQPIEAIPLAVKNSGTKNGEAVGIAEVEVKTLAKHLSKGIDRFDVSYIDAGEHKATDVVMSAHVWRIDVRGSKNLPQSTQAVCLADHQSHWSPLRGGAQPRRVLEFLAHSLLGGCIGLAG